MNPLTWVAIAVILLIIFVAVTLHKGRQARSRGAEGGSTGKDPGERWG